MTKRQKPKFFSCSIHLMEQPWNLLKRDPVGLHHQSEAMEKMHRFCHEIHQVPITWLVSWPSLHKFKDRLIDFIRNHGDEVAIMDGTIYSSESLEGQAQEYQSWVEECGLSRPDPRFQSKEAEVRQGSISLQDMTYEDQKTALSYLKRRYDEILGQNTRVLASPWNNGDTIRIMRELGLTVAQGYCWNYFCEGINHKGCLIQPFNVSTVNHVVPDQAATRPVLGIQWGPLSPAIVTRAEAHARMSAPGFCLTAMELVNRSEGHDKFRYHEKVIQETFAQEQWNEYAFIPLQHEAFWMDEAEMPPEHYDQFPRFNTSNTEIFYAEIETALRCGGQGITLGDFADWHRENVGETSPWIYYSEDFLPELRSKGKDQAYQPFVYYANKDRQYWFGQERGMNYVRRYLYNPPVPNAEIADEYPFDNEPRVYLQVKSGINLFTGIRLNPEGACYEVGGLELSAYDADPDYAAMLWEANIPSYVTDADIQISGGITGFRTLREKNGAILFANLKQGLNKLAFRSDLPNQHIRIKSTQRVGKRYEIWIENDADEVQLHSLYATLDSGLRIGGFWWDGFYSHTIFRYGWGAYDRESGALEIRCFYPVTLKVNRGLTRCSVELL